MRVFTIIIFTILLAGCSADLYHLLDESSELPPVTAPRVQSLAVAGGVEVSWKADERADGYLLYRSDSPGGSYALVYEGRASGYLDKDVVLDRIYYYRLSKRKGDRVLESSSPVPGVSSVLVATGSGEPVRFDSEVVGVVYSYSDGVSSLSLSHSYYVELEAYKGMRITVEALDNLGPSELRLVTESGTQLLSEGESFIIRNLRNERGRESFRIEPVGVLNKAGSYRLRLLYMVN